ncbi:hypothetical protein APHAL10511_003567 [Amanita phalloides]|nr:hypothetical protein APHAL10511_003567 [Amanita phalloides]
MQNTPSDIGKSNRIYSADEETYISSLLSRATAQQNQVRSHIADLERQKQGIIAQIRVLQDEEDSISTQIDDYRAALAPHKRLSGDVLNEIFTWCVLDDPIVSVPWYEPLWEESSDGSYHPDADADADSGSEDSQETYDSSADDATNGEADSYLSVWSASFEEESRMRLPLPLILSHICAAWRHVALSMPLLWSNVSITSFTRRTKRLATEWLSRAGDFPVCITIYDIAKDSIKFNLFAELKDFLLQYHFKTLELPLCSSSCPQLHFILSELPAERTSQLEKLSLVDVEECQLSSVLLKGTWYPHLRELELVGKFKFDFRTFTLPWTALHNLDIELCLLPAADCFDILRQCTSLQTCSLGISSVPESTSIEGQSIHLPTLRDLSINIFSRDQIGMFFRPLTIPSLTALAVSGFSKWSHQDFSEMMRRSNRPLTYLTIELFAEPISLGPILTTAPGLKLLLLDQARFDQDALDGLACGELGRYLQHFTLCNIGGRDPRRLWEMIRRRKENSEHHDVIPFMSFSVPE